MVTVKEKVKAFYKQANENNWTKFVIYANELKAYGVDRCVSYDPKEDCPAGSYRGFYNGTVLKHQRLCDEMSAEEKNTLISLGFSLKPQCFWCRRPDGSASGINDCHILYAGRELTADELWLTDIKQRAIDLGYDIRDCGWIADCDIGWGFWGATITDAWNGFDGFMKETGVTWASGSLIRDFQGGYLYVVNTFYAYGLYNITEPAHDTALSIAITDEAGNPITKSIVGETVHIAGQLKDIVDDVALQGALITLHKNGVATDNTDITDASGIYSIPYTITSADVPTVRFKTAFAGT